MEVYEEQKDELINELFAARKRLVSLEQELRVLDTAMDHLPEGIIIVDAPSGSPRRVSRACLALAGLPRTAGPEEFFRSYGRSWKLLSSDGRTEPRLEELPGMRAIRRGVVIENEEWLLQRADGRRIIIACNAAPVRDAGGTVTAGIISCRDITARRQAEDRIREITFHDRVTGLYNRTYFEEELKRLDTGRELPLTVIMGDINNLKMTNDVFGHAEGDRLLRAIADVLKASCRDEDIVARWGGDEFVLLLPETDPATARGIRERIRRECGLARALPLPLSIALGSATKSAPGVPVEEVLREAEERMYRSKLMEAKKLRSETFAFLFNVLRERHAVLPSHIRDVRELSLGLGRAAGLSRQQMDDLSLAAVFHDIGKVAVADEILSKPDRLSRREWEEMRRFADAGYRLLKSSDAWVHVADIILHCREHWDGSGYPAGLAGETIPVASRILALADAYVVMLQGTPYQPSLPREKALEEVRRKAGSQFDPRLARLLEELLLPAPVPA